MTATEVLREEVKQYIDHADDKTLRIMKAVLEIELENEDGPEEEDWDDLPEDLLLMIDEGIKEGEEGKGISYEQVREKYSKWFRK